MTKVFVTGGGGQVARALARQASAVGTELTRSTVDVTDAAAVTEAILSSAPEVVVHAAAWTDVDGCEDDPVRAWRANVGGTSNVAAATHDAGAHLVYLSTNFVFDGTSTDPYREDDEVHPINVYGETKLGGELVVGAATTIVRSGWICGDGPRNLVSSIVRAIDGGRTSRLLDDVLGQPTDADELAGAILELGRSKTGGTWNVTGPDVLSPLQIGRLVVAALGADPELVTTAGPDDPVRARPAARPVNGVLSSDRWTRAGRRPLAPFAETLPTLIGRVRRGPGVPLR